MYITINNDKFKHFSYSQKHILIMQILYIRYVIIVDIIKLYNTTDKRKHFIVIF